MLSLSSVGEKEKHRKDILREVEREGREVEGKENEVYKKEKGREYLPKDVCKREILGSFFFFLKINCG